jgi:excisionase family DNA binding protein
MIGWLDIQTLSKYCCTSPRTIETWIKERGLRYSRVRGKRLVKREWADDFLEGHEVDIGNEVDRIVSDVCKELKI